MSQPFTKRIESLLNRQKAYFQAGRTRDVEERIAALGRFEEALQAHEKEFLDALQKDMGKPNVEAFLAEYHFVLSEVRTIRKGLKKWHRPRKVKAPLYFWPCRNWIRLEPQGMVLVMAPWNYPLQLALAPLLGAVAAGNTVVLKPSEDAPACEAFLEEFLGECFEKDWVKVEQGGAEFTSALLDHRFDLIFFTGSTRVGQIVAAKAARHLTPCVLELGGKCPCVVDASADLEIAARRILNGKLFNAGQTCFAPDFVAVDSAVKEALVAELRKVLLAYPWEKEMARIVNVQHYERLRQLCGENDFAKGKDVPEALHLAPRIIEVSGWDGPLMQEEIFGPLLPVMTFENQKDLISKLQSVGEPLALYCFSKDESFIDYLTSRVSSGGVCVNDIGKQAMNLWLPFGGKGQSGYGRYRGKRSVETFSYERSYTKRFFLPDPFESLPPRKKQEEFLRKWMK